MILAIVPENVGFRKVEKGFFSSLLSPKFPAFQGPILLFLKTILQRNAPVEHQVRWRGILTVQTKIPLTHKLIGLRCLPSLRHGGLGQPPVPLCNGSRSEGSPGLRNPGNFFLGRRGAGSVNSASYRRTSASAAVSASTQWMVAPLTFRPSAGLPPFEAGSYSQRTSITSPAAFFMQPVQRIR